MWRKILAYLKALGAPAAYIPYPQEITFKVRQSNFEDVYQFHAHFHLLHPSGPVHLTQRKLHERIAFMTEELQEFMLAVHEQDLVAQADALIDLVYVAQGTAVMLGLPWQDLWKAVHGANMTKQRRTSLTGDHHDVVKPEGWTSPEPLMEHILQRYGYRKSQWCQGLEELLVTDILCLDDPHHMKRAYEQHRITIVEE